MEKSMMNKMRELPLFPFMPIVPLIVMGTVVSLSILNYRAVKRIEEKLKHLDPSRSL